MIKLDKEFKKFLFDLGFKPINYKEIYIRSINKIDGIGYSFLTGKIYYYNFADHNSMFYKKCLDKSTFIKFVDSVCFLFDTRFYFCCSPYYSINSIYKKQKITDNFIL